ncbi:MAG TPA: hypothetical protein VJN01_07360, partial [Xanthomonadales bacterium]|nr:hypothetical protein [Xanthomonadales bacterium]
SNRLIVTRAVLTALVATVLLSACLLTRLYAFKQQFCDYQDNFSFSTDDEFRVNLLHPILLDSDVIWLAGAQPSKQQQDEQSGQMQWIVDKVLPAQSVPDPEFDELSIEMDFQVEDEKYKLHQVRMDQRFAYVVSPDLMERHADNVCNSSWLVFGRSGEIDLADADLSGQPGRQEIMDYLGQPTTSIRDDAEQSLGMRFEYRLRGSKRAQPQYSFEFWHDAQSGELLRSTANSIRFSSTTDFVQKKLWVKIR